MSYLLDVRDLRTFFFTDRGIAKAVDQVSLRLLPGQVLGIVGESGCGKSITALSIMRLIPTPPGRIVSGEIWFDGRELLSLSEEAMQSIRGNQMAMIFQEPMTSLNPIFRVEEQIREVIQRHEPMRRQKACERVVALLRQVGIPSPQIHRYDYPHQMSGGMRQRVMIAMALACHPQLIIADEPTTALDVTIQAQILNLLQRLRKETGTAILLITHDLGVIAQIADQVGVMYAGRIVELATTRELFRRPLHPYTQGLLRSIPATAAKQGRKRLEAIPGVVPPLFDLPAGCKFNTRCTYTFDRCMEDPEPELLPAREGHPVRCRLYEES